MFAHVGEQIPTNVTLADRSIHAYILLNSGYFLWGTVALHYFVHFGEESICGFCLFSLKILPFNISTFSASDPPTRRYFHLPPAENLSKK